MYIFAVTNSSLVGPFNKREVILVSHRSWRKTHNCHFAKPAQSLTTLANIYLTPIDSCGSQCSSKKLLSAPDKTFPENWNQSKCRGQEILWCTAPADRHIYNTTPAQQSLRLRDHCEEGKRDCKSQRNRKFAVRLCFLQVSERWHLRSLINMAA